MAWNADREHELLKFQEEVMAQQVAAAAAAKERADADVAERHRRDALAAQIKRYQELEAAAEARRQQELEEEQLRAHGLQNDGRLLTPGDTTNEQERGSLSRSSSCSSFSSQVPCGPQCNKISNACKCHM